MGLKGNFICLVGAAALAPCAGLALEPDELFDKVSPSIVAIHGFDTRVKPFTYGSGVVIAPETVITNCHVLAKTRTIIVRRRNATYKATLQYPDVERDLCQLNVPDLNAPAVALGNSTSIRIGQRTFAIGNPIGLELTLSDGLISGFRKTEGSEVPRIQTSAPASPGSSGGGLFDRDGKLIGITTAGGGPEAQNITIAHPVEWVREVPERGKAAMARRQGGSPGSGEPTASASRPEPVFDVGGRLERPDVRVGDRWRFQVTDGFTGLKSTVVLEVTMVTDNRIHTRSSRSETARADTAAAGGMTDEWDRNWNQIRQGDMEFKPYYPMLQFPLEQGRRWAGEVRFPVPRATAYHQLSAHVARWERVTVPAGTFDAIRISIRGHFRAEDFTGNDVAPSGTVDNTIWYAPAVRQIVKKEIKENDGGQSRYTSMSVVERWELVEYKPK